jgi:hypothetical protein
MPLNDVLDFRLFVPWNDCEAGRSGTNRPVLHQAHQHRLCTPGAAALAGEVNGAISVGFEEVRGDLSHSLVHFPEERFVSGQTFVACRHDGILSTLIRESISRQKKE